MITSSSMSSVSVVSKELKIEFGGGTNKAVDPATGVCDPAPLAVTLGFLGFLGVVGGTAMAATDPLVDLETGIMAGGGMGSGVSLGCADLGSTSLSSSSPSAGPSEVPFLF